MEILFQQINNRLLNIESLLSKLDFPGRFEQQDAKHLSVAGGQEIQFDIAGLANYLNCSVQTIHNLKKSGEIPFYRLGRKVYFKKREIDEIARVAKIKGGKKKW
jgi:excisionase family DNA binding protein